MYAPDFEEVVSEAFHFLVTEHGYTTFPSQVPEHAMQPYSKVYRRNERWIAFQLGFDIGGFVALEFSPIDLSIRKPPCSQLNYFKRWRFTLSMLLEGIGQEKALISSGKPQEVAAAYAGAVREHALDVVAGDFSVFPSIVFTLEKFDGRPSLGGRTAAVYSSLELAETAALSIPEKRLKPTTTLGITGWALDGETPWW